MNVCLIPVTPMQPASIQLVALSAHVMKVLLEMVPSVMVSLILLQINLVTIMIFY